MNLSSRGSCTGEALFTPRQLSVTFGVGWRQEWIYHFSSVMVCVCSHSHKPCSNPMKFHTGRCISVCEVCSVKDLWLWGWRAGNDKPSVNVFCWTLRGISSPASFCAWLIWGDVWPLLGAVIDEFVSFNKRRSKLGFIENGNITWIVDSLNNEWVLDNGFNHFMKRKDD